MKIQLQNSADHRALQQYFEKRVGEYQQDLCLEGLTQQQYDILRGRIKELQDLLKVLSLSHN